MTRSTYHHGDLRKEALEQTTAFIAEHGPEAVSLRVVASRVGVSPSALYHHFADKSALLCAVAASGFAAITAAMQGAAEDAGDDATRVLEAIGVAYVLFADRNRGHFRVMFQRDLADPDADPEFRQHADAAYACLLDGVAALPVARLRGADRETVAVSVWATVHGLARLWVEGPLARKSEATDVEPIVRAVLAHVL